MPAMAAAFGRMVLWALGSFLGRVLTGIGLGVVAYQGVDVLVSTLNAKIASALGGIDTLYLEAVNAFGFSQAIGIITSAYLARFGTQTAYRFALRRGANS